jgi:hypothetical protein
VFERFTERARKVVVLAQEEARALGHNYIGSEHLLLGLLREEEGLAARVLEHLDITPERVRAQVERIVNRGEGMTEGQIPFTPRAKRVLELAGREALSLGQNYIGTEHILLGLTRENEGVATRILLDFDADWETIRSEVIRMLSGPSGRRVPPAPAPRPLMRARPPLDWGHATLLWRPEGLELRVPLSLSEASAASFAADEVWSTQPLAALRREIWSGWLGLASPTLLDDIDPGELRRLLDGAAKRADDRRGRDRGQAEDFLRALREEP